MSTKWGKKCLIVKPDFINGMQESAKRNKWVYAHVLNENEIPSGTVQRNGFSQSYRSWAKRNGYDPQADLLCIRDGLFDKLCKSFMLKQEDWIATPPKVAATPTAEPPENKNVVEKTAKDSDECIQEDFLIVLQSIAEELKKHNQIMCLIHKTLSKKDDSPRERQLIQGLSKKLTP